MLRVELFEDVGGQRGIALDRFDDLLSLFVRGAFHDVGDLRWVQPAQPLQGHEQLRRRHMPDEWLYVLPIEDHVSPEVGPPATRHEAPQHRLRAAVDAGEVPAIDARRQDQVMGLDDAALGHVDEVAAEHIRRKKDLARTPLESLGAQRVRVETHAAGLEALDHVFADEHVLGANPHLESLDGRVCAVRQLDDEVLDPADFRARRVEDGAPQHLRQHQSSFLVVVPGMIHARVLPAVTHRFSPCPLDLPHYAAALRGPHVSRAPARQEAPARPRIGSTTNP